MKHSAAATAHPRKAKASKAKAAGQTNPVENSLAPATHEEVVSSPTTDTPAATPPNHRSMKHMDLVLTRSKAPRKTNRLVIYNIKGRSGSVQFLSTLFGGSQKEIGNPPETLTLSGEFAEPKPVKAKMTAEERKALRAAQPKPTLAEKIAKAEARMAALRAKLEAAEAAQANA